MESFMLFSQMMQLSHYAALLNMWSYACPLVWTSLLSANGATPTRVVYYITRHMIVQEQSITRRKQL